MSNKYFDDHDPLSNDFVDLLKSNPGFVLLNELKHVQSNLNRLGWNKDSIDKAIDILECMRQKTKEYLTSYSDKWYSTNDKNFLDSSWLFELSLNNLPTPFSRETLTTTSDQRNLVIPPEMNAPIITPYMMGKILEHKSSDLISHLNQREIYNCHIRELYGVIFFLNIWQFVKINQNATSDFTDVCFWTKNATLAYDNFNCLDRWANVTMCSNLSDWDESIIPKKQSNWESELASDRAKLIINNHHSRSKGGKGKKKNCREFAIKTKKTSNIQEANLIYDLLANKNFFDETPFISREQGIRTIKDWITKPDKTSDHGIDHHEKLIDGIKKLKGI